MKQLFLPLCIAFFAATTHAMEGQKKERKPSETELQLILLFGSSEFTALKTFAETVEKETVNGALLIDTGDRKISTALKAEQVASLYNHLTKLKRMMENK